ncbi:hypothetical protein Hypma_014903 [Hypsizygus marmoreus]|uniref:F-box domain-containing protein n=1 Tax=Hypsizygus marmoreus TaxID=39966 RepID=A0A369K774_HYPMA|nr:hypothetical protein Hypma_014903 [Hypsizygus marmoreus]
MGSSARDLVLVDDVLLRILSLSDIPSVVLVGQTSRHFHNLAFSKQVWLALLSDLHARNFVDLIPGQRLHDLSTNELVDLAKRIVLGPRSWSSSHPSGSTLAQQIAVKANVYGGPGSLYWENCAHLLSGGQFCLFLKSKSLECWDLAQSKVVWIYQGNWPESWVTRFAIEVVEGGQKVIILVAVRVLAQPERENFVEVLNLDLSTGTSKTILSWRGPDSENDNSFSYCKICGDFGLLGFIDLDLPSQVILLQISTESCVILDMPKKYSIDLLPAHLILMRPSLLSDSLEIVIWMMQALVNSNSQGEIFTRIEDVAPAAVLTLPDPQSNAFYLSSHLSPLCEDSSILWILTSSLQPSSRGEGLAIHKWHISHPKSKPLTLHPISSKSFPDIVYPMPTGLRNVSFAGYMKYHDFIFSLAACHRDGFRVDLPHHGDNIQISPYSGTLVYSTREKIVVNYYE